MSSRLACWLSGHDWGPWKAGYQNLFGVEYSMRRCRQCGALDRCPERLIGHV